MWASTLCPFSSSTRNIALGRGSTTVPSTSIASSLATLQLILCVGTRPEGAQNCLGRAGSEYTARSGDASTRYTRLTTALTASRRVGWWSVDVLTRMDREITADDPTLTVILSTVERADVETQLVGTGQDLARQFVIPEN